MISFKLGNVFIFIIGKKSKSELIGYEKFLDIECCDLFLIC